MWSQVISNTSWRHQADLPGSDCASDRPDRLLGANRAAGLPSECRASSRKRKAICRGSAERLKIRSVKAEAVQAPLRPIMLAQWSVPGIAAAVCDLPRASAGNVSAALEVAKVFVFAAPLPASMPLSDPPLIPSSAIRPSISGPPTL
jgi:hypothetical protein